MTDAEGAQQLKLAQDVGGMDQDDLATISRRSATRRRRPKTIAEKTPALAAAAKTLTDKLVAVEGDMTQLQGEAGEDCAELPGPASTTS